ncbi:type II toxin-antitoxin system HicA family toxin [Alcaligenes endophyticus]|uniref:Type II toxin-antitoxin system HicA family toxin n=1 Tax=Alcaligenes endophyticus TaxID=1929088 RepID=A0ABT8EL38_9BURK|nr:type II toxin-antitoxin system HicA family toxin [Alcaligenes endophyticus]MCX5590638.1 type II toxin-antitoxin system HicA family toxin [Alcaligenes endophyticus]MDN4121998.1 type II toxin-antitoxin system HicA family toxin [Alcaligenes endophyticus]
MKAKHRKTLELLYSRPTPASLQWSDVLALLRELGAEITEREGSRVAVYLFQQVRVMHRPHPSTDMDKAAVTSLKQWLERNGISS